MVSLSLRRAALDDYSAVMRIGKSFSDVMDYLPATYNSMTTDPSWHGYVVERNKEVVAYYGYHIIDDGQSLMARSTRTLKHFQRTGVIRYLTENISFPSSASRYKSTVKSHSPFIVTSQIVFKRAVFGFKKHMTPQCVTKPRTEDFGLLKIVDKEEMRNIFSCEKVKQLLFPGNTISVRYIFLDITPGNIDFICRFCTNRFTSYNEDGSCKLFTLAVHYPCESGFTYHMECYGDLSNFSDFKCHLNKHMSLAETLCGSSTLYFYIYSWYSDRYNLQRLANDFLIERNYANNPLDYTCYIAQESSVANIIPNVNDSKRNEKSYL